jgi:dsRNA-specific ribonuclease
VRFNELVLGHGSGKTKQQAEQMAAKEALQKKAS